MKISDITPDDVDDVRELVVLLTKIAEEYEPPISIGALITVVGTIYKNNPCKHGAHSFITMCCVTLNEIISDEDEVD